MKKEHYQNFYDKKGYFLATFRHISDNGPSIKEVPLFRRKDGIWVSATRHKPSML